MTIRRTMRSLALTVAVLALSAPAFAADDHGGQQPPRLKWSFSGPFGKYDQAQLQRGFKVYKEVCAGCHSLSLLSFRNLAEAGGPGFTSTQATAIATEYQIQDGPNDAGEMFERPGRLADRFPRSFPNEQTARAANGGALPPDFSVIAKARTYERGFPWFVFDMFTQYQEQGPDYIAALLKGYAEKPKEMTMAEGMSYNIYFPGHAIAMRSPLEGGQVSYDDGSPTTLDQYAKDVAAFLMWAAEPHMTARKRIGFQVMIFLILLSGLLYFTKKKVWASAH
jgi:ubiquinol-cytochrome c reductase cytochrome b/c1 subunit